MGTYTWAPPGVGVYVFSLDGRPYRNTVAHNSRTRYLSSYETGRFVKPSMCAYLSRRAGEGTGSLPCVHPRIGAHVLSGVDYPYRWALLPALDTGSHRAFYAHIVYLSRFESGCYLAPCPRVFADTLYFLFVSIASVCCCVVVLLFAIAVSYGHR